ncbi:Initiation-specific alpha-1,6-mannosyltransferase [Cytospora mali]|uniref:Initiation-specific alpha-1,6-mannosyltransferase n=1 Tax=Cytospora mali TaxID=578113 RepID=A0A194UZY7_CYTMA|nr:Initiation-specific alpha-1,6-mannosyltransferase [Valsa mali var. pyri (nom. inval.)]
MVNPQQPTPPEELVGIPKKIWYKLGPKGLNDDTRKWTETCITQNPQYHAEFLTDQSADNFVSKRFADRPDIVDTFMALTVPILKADLLRYLILYAEGGVWFDLDVSCEGIPIDDWIPEQFRQDANLVVGWEFDAGYHFEFDRQFTTWTVLAKKGVGHLMAVVNDIVRTIGELAEAHGVPIAGLKVDMVGDIVDLTGPRRFEQNVIESLERSLNKTDGWNEYYEILEPKMVGDVVILPGHCGLVQSEVSGQVAKRRQERDSVFSHHSPDYQFGFTRVDTAFSYIHNYSHHGRRSSYAGHFGTSNFVFFKSGVVSKERQVRSGKRPRFK